MRAAGLVGLGLVTLTLGLGGCGHEDAELIPGPAGADGVDGQDGAPGAPGPAGDEGAQGPAGVDGLACWDLSGDGVCDTAEDVDSSGACDALDCQGAAGPQGPTGAQGAVGPQGATGPQGIPGAQGSAGAQGATGPQGPAGADGAPGAPGAPGADGLACWDTSGDGVCDGAEDLDSSGTCDALDCQATVDTTGFAASNQSCAPGDYVAGIDGVGNILCATDTVYTAGFGIDLASDQLSVNTVEVVTREYGPLQVGNDAVASMGTGPFSGAVDVTVFDRNGSTFGVYRCIKVNLSVVECLDVLSGTRVQHVSFSPNEQVMFSTANFDILTYLDGSSPFDASTIVRNNASSQLFYELKGGL